MNSETPPWFIPLTIQSAPDESKLLLERIRTTMGFIPNLMGIFAHVPSVLQGYVALENAFKSSSFSPRDQQLILLATSVENSCNYCTAAHATLAQTFLLAPSPIINAIVHGWDIPDPKISALVRVVKEVVRERGYVTRQTLDEFLSVGYTKEHVMELLLGVALKTISNYVDHMSPVPIDRRYANANH